MDIFAHGLWTNALFAVQSKYQHRARSRWEIWLAVFFGVAPDLVAFTPLFIVNIWHAFMASPGKSAFSLSNWAGVYAHNAYNFTHSLIICAFVLLLVWRVWRKLPIVRTKFYWPLLGWPLHILIDIPSHTDKFFPTPFLFPVSDFRVSGVSWGNPWFMAMNYSLLLAVYLWLYLSDKKSARIRATA